MKRITTVLMMAFFAVFLTSFSLKAEGGTADLTIHFQNWNAEYDGLGNYGWEGLTSKGEHDGLDDFGAKFVFNDVDITRELNFIAVRWADKTKPEVWGGEVKETGDIKIAPNTLKAGIHNHVYVLQGASTSGNNPGYFLASNDHHNILLVYADPSGSYEENIGLHAWGWSNFANSEWSTPSDVFTNGASHTAIPEIKVAMIQTENIAGAGFIVYAGGDENKKTGDVKETLLADLYGENKEVGNVTPIYVYSKGSAYTANDNITNDLSVFVEEAFSFRILPMGIDRNGQYTGTYAPVPNQVLVSLSALISNPRHGLTDETEIAAAINEVQSWFTVEELDGAALEIDEVHFDQSAETIKDFVVILKNNLDITKDYTIEFDLGLEGDENRIDAIEIDLDRDAPEITFASPSEIVGKEEDERIILIEWNKKFPANRFPTIIVNDNRDGDISHLAYVPSGEFSTINTNVVGDYKIMLRVEDRWGNVTEETFIFRVTKDVK